MRRTLLASIAALALAGCHVVKYDTGRPPGPRVVKIPLNFYLWGLVGERVVDLDVACPAGAARWENRATAGDAIIDVITVGVWSPRTVTVECVEGGAR